MTKIQYLQFVDRTYQVDMRVFIEGGITLEQKKEIQEKVSDLVEIKKEECNDIDFSYYDIIEEVLDSLNLKYKYPIVDATIYL